MPTYARFHENTVVEVFITPEHQTINDFFHPQVGFQLVDNGTQVGFFIGDDGVLTNPNPPPPPPPVEEIVPPIEPTGPTGPVDPVVPPTE